MKKNMVLFFLIPCMGYAKVQIQNVEWMSKTLKVESKEALLEDNIRMEALPDCVQVTFLNASLLKAMVKTFESGVIKKIFLYAFSPDTVRLRITPFEMTPEQLFVGLKIKGGIPFQLEMPIPLKETEKSVVEKEDIPLNFSPVITHSKNEDLSDAFSKKAFGGSFFLKSMFFLCGLGFLLWIGKKMGTGSVKKKGALGIKEKIGDIKVVSRKFLDGKKSIATVQVQVAPQQFQWFLIGIGLESLQLLGSLDIEEPVIVSEALLENEEKKRPSFAEIMQKKVLLPNLQMEIKNRLDRVKRL